MLDNIKSIIKELPDISFERYFVDYVMRVQDENIEEEIRYMRKVNSLDPLLIVRAVGDSFERMKSIC